MKQKRNYSVYLHTSHWGKYYVGITSQSVKRRWQNGNGYKGQVFYRAIEKYGWNNIDHEVIASNLTKEEAENFEVVLIKELHSNNPTYGYNIDNGGNSVGMMSEDTKRKKSEQMKGEKNPNFGKTLSERHKRKISEATKGANNPNYGKVWGEDVRQRMREGHKNISQETREKMKENHADFKRGCHPKAKKVVCEGRQFDCIRDCADFYGISKSTMTSWLNGTYKMRQDFVEKGLRYFVEGGGGDC